MTDSETPFTGQSPPDVSTTARANGSASQISGAAIGGAVGGCVVILVMIAIISCAFIYLLVKSHSKQKAKDPSIHLTTSSSEEKSSYIPTSTNELYATTLSRNQAYGSINPDEQIYDYIDEKENDFNIKTEKNEAYISTPHITLNTNESYATVVPPTPNDSNGPCKEEEELYI